MKETRYEGREELGNCRRRNCEDQRKIGSGMRGKVRECKGKKGNLGGVKERNERKWVGGKGRTCRRRNCEDERKAVG